MENVKAKEFVLKISELWNEQKKREVLYLTALKKDSMSSFRKVLVQGHFSALFFQKEILGFYDYFKCLFTDKELCDLNQKNDDYAELLFAVEEKERVMEILKTNEANVMQHYQSVFKYFDLDPEMHRILNAQLNRISEFYEILSDEEVSDMDYTSVA